MKKMIKALMFAVVLSVATQSFAHEGFQLGLGLGSTHSLTPDDFKSSTKTGEAHLYWLGYGFNSNWGVELSHESYDFDQLNSHYNNYSLSGVYTFFADSSIHPIAKVGAGVTEITSIFDVKARAPQAKLAVGIEGDFKYVSVGALFNYIFSTRANVNPGFENASILIPAIYLTIHYTALEKRVSKSEAPIMSAPVAEDDTDGDSVADNEDKCPNTKPGIEVNGYGCALTEKVSVKLQVEFDNGKSTLDIKFNGEIISLANFMAKYPNTIVEIACHTDTEGSKITNENLSKKRAESVKQALVKAGVDSKRVSAKGYGSVFPIADNKTVEGRQVNRRVMAEISVALDQKK